MEKTNEKILNVHIEKTTARLKEKIKIVLEISGDYGFVNESKILINQQNGSNEQEIKMTYNYTEKNINYFSCELEFNNLGIYYFCIKIIINNELKWIKLDLNTNKPVLTQDNLNYWTITIYDNNFEVPSWAKGKIMYHIMVDRFYKSEKYKCKEISNRMIKKWGEMPKWNIDSNEKYCNNDFFMGNLKGIEEKIEYIKNLGVEIIYLSPICKSQSNHRYDTSDYEIVDPYLGKNKDLKSLCSKAHKNGIKIIIDAAFNHTGNDSKYFNQYNNYKTLGAYQSEKSPYYEWYKKTQNNKFSYWWGFKNLPVCDCNNISWQNYIYGKGGIIDKWFKLGIDGLRLDVADELTDEFIENIRIAVKRNKEDGFILGEVWENAVTKEKDGKQRTYLLGKGLDSVMNYPFTNAILKFVRFGNYKLLINTITQIQTQYPKEVVFSLMNSLSTHDIIRAISSLVAEGIDNNENNLIWDIKYDRKWQYEHNNIEQEKYIEGKKLLKIASIIQYFLPGNPCIYYGDEIGMYGYKDPFNRKCFEWDNIDKELYKFFVELGKIRKNNNFINCAKLKIIFADEENFIFERYDKEKSILIAVNRKGKVEKNRIPEKYKKQTKLLLDEYEGILILKNGNNK